MATDWIMRSAQLPPNKVDVLVAYGRNGVVFGQTVAVYVREHSVDCDAYEYDEHELFADYDEGTDAYYWPAGWYERQSANPEYGYCAMTEDVIAWMHLPQSPAIA